MNKQAEHVYDVVIVGTGFGGISAAIELIKRDVSNFVMLERRSFAGGTWLQNSYPGAAVDVQSPLYSLSGHPYPWSQLFAKQNELADYTNKIIEQYKLSKHIRLEHEVSQATWDQNQWHIEIKNEKSLFTKILINATGPLSTPSFPSVPNFEQFKGQSFHSNDWQHDVDLSGKDIAIIGSGASSVQIVPAIIDEVKRLFLVQRTPHWILPRPDWVFSPWLKRFLSYRPVYKGLRWLIYWLLELRVIAFKYSKHLLHLVGTRPATKHLKSQVHDTDLRKRLTPDFIIGCKRILVSNTFYPALQRENCELVDNTNPLVGFTQKGLKLADGTEHKVDIVVFATGYKATEAMVSYKVIGENNAELQNQWSNFPRAYLGTAVPQFPNFFVVTGPNTGIGHTSAIFVIESQLKYIMQCVDKVLRGGVESIQPTERAEDEYTTMIHNEMRKTVWSYGGCQSWYQNKDGKVIAMFPGFSFRFRQMCKRFTEEHHLIKEA